MLYQTAGVLASTVSALTNLVDASVNKLIGRYKCLDL